MKLTPDQQMDLAAIVEEHVNTLVSERGGDTQDFLAVVHAVYTANADMTPEAIMLRVIDEATPGDGRLRHIKEYQQRMETEHGYRPSIREAVAVHTKVTES